MADVYEFNSLLNTNEGGYRGESSFTVPGPSWFKYNGIAVDTIYISVTNVCLGFGKSAAHFGIGSGGMGKLVSYATKEGVLAENGKKFFKVNMVIYTNSRKTSYTFCRYELFFIEDQTIFINIINHPTGSYSENWYLSDGTNKTVFEVPKDTEETVYVLIKNVGGDQQVTYEKYVPYESISVASLPNKVRYYKKELLDTAGLKVVGNIGNGNSKEITNYSVSGFDSSSEGTNTVTVIYETLSCNFDVTILQTALISISIGENTKTEYDFNTVLNMSEIEIIGRLNDGTTTSLNPKQAQFMGFNSSTPGMHKVTVTYGEFTTSFNVTISAPAINDLLGTREGMQTVLGNQARKGYIVPIDGVDWFKYGARTADTIYVASNGWVGIGRPKEHVSLLKTKGSIDNTSLYYVFRQTGSLKSGKKFLKIRTEGYLYSSNQYSGYAYVYELFLIEGQTLLAYIQQVPYSDYTSRYPAYIFDEKNRFELNEILSRKNGGEQPISILVENAGVCQRVSYGSYNDEVYTGIEIVTQPNRINYFQRENFDRTGMVVKAIKNDGTKEIIENYGISGYDSSKIGSQTLTVLFRNLSTTFNINVSGKDYIKITCLPKISYAQNDVFDSTGLIVTLFKADQTNVEITENCDISAPDMSLVGKQAVTIKYNDLTAVFGIEIGAAITKSTSNFKPFGRGGVKSDGSLDVFKYSREVIVPKGVKTIASSAFNSCKELGAAYLPDTLETMGTYAFDRDYGLSKINLPPSLKSVGAYALRQIVPKEIWIQNIESISAQAFYNCFLTEKIHLFSAVKELKSKCFSALRKVESFVIPKSVTTIATDSLSSITGLKSIYFMNPTLANISLTKADDLKIYGFSGSTAETYATNNSIDFVALGDFTTLSLVKKPDKLKYKIGDIFDLQGLELQASYSSGEVVSIPPDSISGFDSSSEGTKTITLLYETESVSFDIEILSAIGIEIASLPLKTKFQKDEDFVEEGLKISEVYSDGSKVEIKGFTLNGYDSSTLGNKTVTASYDGNAVTFPVEVNLDGTIAGIKVLSEPTKVKYKPGDTFSKDGLQVGLIYDDGSTKLISDTAYTLSSPNMNEIGTQSISVTYTASTEDGVKTIYAVSFSIEVMLAVESIEVNERYGNNDCFFVGDENTGNYRYAVKSIKVLYDDGSNKIIYSGFTETEVDTSKVGSFYTVTSYGGKEVQSPYTVYGSPFVTPTGYEQKNAATLTLDLDTGEGIIEGTGSLGYPNNVPSSFSSKIKTLELKEGITGIKGFSYCRVTYIGIPSTVTSLTDKSFSFLSTTTNVVLRINAKKDSIPDAPWGLVNATIIWAAKPQSLSIEQLPTQIKYMVGDTFDPTGMECSVVYSNGKTYLISEGLSYSSVDMSESGKQLVTVSYTEDETTLSAKFGIEVVAKIAGIRISSFPSKIYYKIGESLDLSGLEVVTVDGAGNENALTDYEVDGFDSSDAGSKTVTVFYNTEINGVNTFVGSDSFQVRVTKDGANPFTNGDVEVTVHWINGEFEDLTNDHIDQSSFNLRESICDENYFIFGGCICNQLSFRAHHEQFDSTEEEFYPQGEIEVYLECNGTSVKVFTGEIDSAEREADSMTRDFVAYDGLYKLKNTDIAWWYKNQTTDKNKLLTQKEFRDKLFEFLGIEQVPTTLHWDSAYVPNTNNANEIIVISVLKDLCLQNDRFGHMNRDGKFEYLKLRQNSYKYGETVQNKPIYKYYNNEEIHLDTFKSFTAKEGRIWFPHTIFADPEPDRAYGFTQGEPTAQEAYENNVYYNRNSFFVGNEDWMNYVWNADEYGQIKRSKPIMNICYGMFINLDLRKYYRAQGYTAEVEGNPLNTVGQAVELYHTRQVLQEDGTYKELKWYVHSYIMTRTLQLGATGLIDTYSAKNAPFNSNSRQLGTNTPEVTATVNKTRTELPTISYAEFTDGSDFSSQALTDILRKANLRCIKFIDKSKYEDLVTAGMDRPDTLYFTREKSSEKKSKEESSS